MTQVSKKTISDETFEKVESRIADFKASGFVRFPADYSPENALKAAWLILQELKDRNKNLVLQSCTKESIANSLLKMVVLGLNPIKKQCDFIAYGNQLTCEPSYAGNIALAKRHGGLKSIKANAIFKDDEFEFEVDGTTGKKVITKHVQKLDNLGSKEIRGAYAILTLEDGSVDTEIMNMIQIRQAWAQGATKGDSPAHKNFPDQMSIKTVVNRACKLIIRSSDDAALMTDDEETMRDPVQDRVDNAINQQANKTPITMDDDEDDSVGQLQSGNEIPESQIAGTEISIDEDEIAESENQFQLQNEPGF